MHYIMSGTAQPDAAVLNVFFEKAKQTVAETLPDTFEVRSIGGNPEVMNAIYTHIRTGEKTGTISMPWVAEQLAFEPTKVGDAMILIDFHGVPQLLLRITGVETVRAANISYEHTKMDGPAVRALDVWLQVHQPYLESLVRPFGLTVDDDTPVSFEAFELLYSADN